MKCPKCKSNRIRPFQPISKELGILDVGMSCPDCGTWIEPNIIPLKPKPEKFEFSEEKKDICRQNLAKGRETKKAKRLALEAANELLMSKRRPAYGGKYDNPKPL
jgi:transcription initiation factor TFIIIB Brf1 subunit/transcription initiation factor TFIIB